MELSDPRALRAYAHPIRLKLVGLLRRSGPLTATQAGEKIGESAASCSFHLRQLAKYGLVEEAGGGKGRERPWRATAISTEWAAGGSDPATAEAGAMLSRVVVEHYFQQAIEWLDRRGGESAEWAEKAVVTDHAVYLTADRATGVTGPTGSAVDMSHSLFYVGPEAGYDFNLRVVVLRAYAGVGLGVVSTSGYVVNPAYASYSGGSTSATALVVCTPRGRAPRGRRRDLRIRRRGSG